MKTSTYSLTLTLRAPVHIPQDVVENVIDYSTMLEALEEGIWNWIPLSDLALMEVDTIFELTMHVNKGRFDDE